MPRAVTPAPRLAAVRASQSLKAPSPTVVRLVGRASVASDVQPRKAFSSRVVRPSANVTLANEAQPAKALAPMEVRDAGVASAGILSAPSKAERPIVCTPAPRVRLAMAGHWAKAYSSTAAADRLTLARAEQL